MKRYGRILLGTILGGSTAAIFGAEEEAVQSGSNGQQSTARNNGAIITDIVRRDIEKITQDIVQRNQAVNRSSPFRPEHGSPSSRRWISKCARWLVEPRKFAPILVNKTPALRRADIIRVRKVRAGTVAGISVPKQYASKHPDRVSHKMARHSRLPRFPQWGPLHLGIRTDMSTSVLQKMLGEN